VIVLTLEVMAKLAQLPTTLALMAVPSTVA